MCCTPSPPPPLMLRPHGLTGGKAGTDSYPGTPATSFYDPQSPPSARWTIPHLITNIRKNWSLGHVWPDLCFLYHFGLLLDMWDLWAILGHFIHSLVLPSWTILGHVGPCRPFWVLWAILGYLGLPGHVGYIIWPLWVAFGERAQCDSKSK